MSSLYESFNELLNRIKSGRGLGHAGFEPIYYLIFDPKEIIEAKRYQDTLVGQLSQVGYSVHTFSIGEVIDHIFRTHRFYPFSVQEDQKDPFNWKRTNMGLSDMLTRNNVLLNRFRETLETLEGKSDAILLVTDLEALHPYFRIGSLENQLMGQFHVPTIFLYPGNRTGSTRLSFLGVYPEDGNYRSVHIGG